MDPTASFYSGPSYVFRGHGFPIYSGSRRQRGGSIFGALKSMAIPFLKNAAKRGIRRAVSFVTDVAGDVFTGSNVKESLKKRGKSHAIKLGKDVASDGLSVLQAKLRGSGMHSRKRRRSRKRTKSRTKTKRRRTNF